MLHTIVIPDAAISAFTRVFGAVWRRSGIQTQTLKAELDSGFAPLARPGMTLRVVMALVLSLIACTAALANGVVTERKAGGLVFKKSDTIGIASEDLFLSREEVRVSYIYNSVANAPQNVTISFPMPEVPLDDGPDTEDVFMNDAIPDGRNYMNFKVKVHGREVKARPAERALLKGRDVTVRLQRAGVPLLLVKDRAEALKRIPDDVKRALVKEGLLEFSNAFYMPNWSYQVLFEWEQSFRPGPTKVDISYRPIVGDAADYGDYFDTGAGVKKYCVDPALRASLRKRRAQFEPVWLGYVLKTARFWNGPIEKFRLVVDKGKPENLVAFCPLNSRKISPTRFEWTASNFSPDNDIGVVFFIAVGGQPN